jgi:hypothetical protein
MRVIPGPQGLPEGYEYEANGRKVRWPADPIAGRSPILHIKSFHPTDDWYGLSRIEAAARAIDGHNESGRAQPGAVAEWRAAFWRGGVQADRRRRPSGAAQRAATPGHSGADRGAFPGSAQCRPAALPRRRFQLARNGAVAEGHGFHQSQGFLGARDRAGLRISGYLLGLPEGATFSNVAEARLALWEQTILPLADLMRDELMHWLVPRFGEDLELDYDRDRISALAERRRQVWERVQRADFLTINERRAEVGFGPICGRGCARVGNEGWRGVGRCVIEIARFESSRNGKSITAGTLSAV